MFVCVYKLTFDCQDCRQLLIDAIQSLANLNKGGDRQERRLRLKQTKVKESYMQVTERVKCRRQTKVEKGKVNMGRVGAYLTDNVVIVRQVVCVSLRSRRGGVTQFPYVWL